MNEKKLIDQPYDKYRNSWKAKFFATKAELDEAKAEIERLKKRHGVALLRNDDLDLENYELKKQVDELTEEKSKYQEKWQTSYMNELNLQKQVDELTKTQKKIIASKYDMKEKYKAYLKYYQHLVLTEKEGAFWDGVNEGKKQAVKDTAKEILGLILAKEFEKGDYLTDDELHELFKERYGVEVE